MLYFAVSGEFYGDDGFKKETTKRQELDRVEVKLLVVICVVLAELFYVAILLSELTLLVLYCALPVFSYAVEDTFLLV